MQTIIEIPIESSLYQDTQVFAKELNKTIPELVNEYFMALVKKKQRDDWYNSLDPVTRSLVGALKTDKDFDYKEVVSDYLWEKYS